jgi:hypothetical protein
MIFANEFDESLNDKPLRKKEPTYYEDYSDE